MNQGQYSMKRGSDLSFSQYRYAIPFLFQYRVHSDKPLYYDIYTILVWNQINLYEWAVTEKTLTFPTNNSNEKSAKKKKRKEKKKIDLRQNIYIKTIKGFKLI